MMKFSISQLLDAHRILSEFCRSSESLAQPTKNKLSWCIYRNLERLEKVKKTYIDEVSTLTSQYASVDNDGNFLFEDEKCKNYKYTLSNQKAKEKAVNELLAKEVEFQPFLYNNHEIIKQKFSFLICTPANGILFDIKQEEIESLFEQLEDFS